MITTAPVLPAWLVLVLLAVLAAGVLHAYRRTPALLALRLAAVAVLALLLLNPVRIPPPTSHEAARLALVVDASASMGLADAAPAADRLRAAQSALDAVASAAGPRFAVEWWTLDDRLRPGRPAAAAGDTAFDPLASFAVRPPAAIVLASDGAERGTSEPDQALAAAGVPVSCIAVGSAEPAGNVAVRLDAPSPTALPGQDLTLTASISCTPAYAGLETELTLSGADAQVRRRVRLRDGERIAWDVHAGEAAGERQWTVALPALDGEATAADNTSTCCVRVVDRRLAVVVVEGRPWWDSAAAVRAWRRDRQLATVAHWRAGPRTLATGGDGGSEPRPDADAIARADLIVLGLEPERILDTGAIAAVVRAVEDGAGLILLAPGARDPRLAALDPVLWSSAPPRSVAPQPAPGAAPLLPADLLSGLPEVLACGADGLRPGAGLLLGEPDRPLAALRRHGAGRVVSVNAEGVWRWSLGREEDAAGRLWRQLARLTVRDPGGLSADRPRYRVGQTARIAAAGTVLRITPPAGDARELALSDGSAALLLDAPGLWRIADGEQILGLPVDADVRELVDTARRDRRLERLANATGGAMASPADAAGLGQRLARRAELMADAPRPEPLVVAWWWWALILTPMLGLEWWLRRTRHGRV